jgi:hypothetical protein
MLRVLADRAMSDRARRRGEPAEAVRLQLPAATPGNPLDRSCRGRAADAAHFECALHVSLLRWAKRSAGPPISIEMPLRTNSMKPPTRCSHGLPAWSGSDAKVKSACGQGSVSSRAADTVSMN